MGSDYTHWMPIGCAAQTVIQRLRNTGKGLSVSREPRVFAPLKGPGVLGAGASLGGKEKKYAHSLPLSAAAALDAATGSRCETFSPALNQSGQTNERQTKHANCANDDCNAGPRRNVNVEVEIVVFHRVTRRLIS